MAKQSYLEQEAITKREEILVRNDYGEEVEYNTLHTNALSNGDPQGKGTGNGGHLFSVPNRSKPKTIDYTNFNTFNGGGRYDIEGRNGIGGREFLQNISIYNANNEYGKNSIDTSANNGQVRF